MPPRTRLPRIFFGAALLCAALALAVPSGRAFADGEGEESGESIEQKIKAQIEKIIKLMRENEKALLEASRGSGKKPDGVEVKPPDVPGMESPPPPDGTAPPLRGDDVRKRLDELLKTSQGSGASIPKELEELVKMIPTRSGQGQGQNQPDPNPGESGSTKPRDGNRQDKPEDGKDPKGAQKPESPAKKPGDKTAGKPPDGEKSDPLHDDAPPWLVNLPEEYRSMITSGDTEHVPQRYRHLVEAYAKWLADHYKGGTGR